MVFGTDSIKENVTVFPDNVSVSSLLQVNNEPQESNLNNDSDWKIKRINALEYIVFPGLRMSAV